MKSNKKFLVYDIVLVTFFLYFALLLRFEFKIPQEYIGFFKLSIIPVIVITIICNGVFHLYDYIWKYASVDELMSIVYSVSLSNIIFIFYSYFISYKLLSSVHYRFPATVHIILWVLSILALGGTRFMYRIVGRNENSELLNNKVSNVLIIGAGDAGAMLIKEIKKHQSLNYNIVGLIDDDLSKIGQVINGIKILGTREEITRICENNNVEEIFIALPSAPLKERKEIYNSCKKTGCKLKTLPGIYEILNGDVNISQLRDVDINDLLGRDPIQLNNENINEYINGKVVLVTGGGGSIGSELCRQIVKFNPKKLVILDIYENNAYDLQMELRYKYPELDMDVVIASIRDFKRLQEVFENYKPYVVFHAAAHKHVPLMESNPAEAIKNNIFGTYNVVKCSHIYKVKRFVQISTDKAVNPTNVMGATKRFCEKIIQAFAKESETEYVAVRFGNVLGSNGSVIPLFKRQIKEGGPVTVTHPEINRFFMTIPEAAQLVIQAGAMARGGEIFVLDMGEPVKIVDLARDLIRLSGLKPDEDIKIEYTGLRPGEKLYEELLMDEVALTSTEHEKIFVEKPMGFNISYIDEALKDFKEVIEGDKEGIIKVLSDKVPTYTRKK
ncbi:nucleoside-diphosphate sugar epimerase [Clostridium botulinum]|uniref:Nucleoside-diphosphate sugar epimerase n=1 Tax=Clostridium botulinum C/D str. DC5 TaxID=1443128 RepID=A0A0A0ICT2_CLOBO|nr:nucleoside-diphosphate sugar epimerase/dehydratase [Clostridium botulinum]KEI06366.1 nucleoside-diphosphate sugar epimerase [Clostridium botulinum C/D str. BKT75002]KEI09185.1 nucleoside-diphosphate sugar epimerase [Clostridium botulinum C/D str. BKT2873]KGM97339.1 nucleoside-diphosphate sugar epimerase [Clostridium botulinum D str. CCUG 7971]KGM99234.1 nucleoside-diphosphate sugar epimerase [Clostridium botulinum C/D str. DC5]KOC46956.1 nucleoside-diphosphate sugar epimerase [Clostridium b